MAWNAEQYDLFRAESEQGIDWRRIDSLRRLCRPLDSLIYLAELDHMRRAPVTAVWLDKYRGYCSFLQYKRAFGHRELIRSLHARMSEAHRATEQGLEIEAYLNLPGKSAWATRWPTAICTTCRETGVASRSSAANISCSTSGARGAPPACGRCPKRNRSRNATGSSWRWWASVRIPSGSGSDSRPTTG